MVVESEPEVLFEDDVGVEPLVDVPLDEEKDEFWPVILGPKPAVKASGTMLDSRCRERVYVVAAVLLYGKRICTIM